METDCVLFKTKGNRIAARGGLTGLLPDRAAVDWLQSALQKRVGSAPDDAVHFYLSELETMVEERRRHHDRIIPLPQDRSGQHHSCS